MRQQLYNLFDPKPGCCVSSLAYEYPADYDVPLHAHATAQLIYAIRGVMEIAATGRLWVIPPQFAIWIPPRTEHRIHMPGAVSMRTLYFRRGVAALLPQTCCVLHMTPLIRELVIETVRLGSLRTRNRLHAALRDVLLAQLKNARPVPTSIPLPSDARALSAARAFMANPASGHSLSHVCLSAGASIRTMERLFRKDVGTSFESWRTQVRIMKGVELLAAGRTVKEAAFQVGYRQPSAFIEMFRRTLGATPKAWVSKLNQSV
jgi:AraC-like DNA-binding protein